jgi:ech hydrogenase subunit D
MLAGQVSVGMDNLLGEVARLKRDGYRFVTMTGVENDRGDTEILYHFDHGFRLRHLHLVVTGHAAVPSITPIFLAAFLAENEIQDLFGIHFQGLLVDYRQMLFLEDQVISAPFVRRATDPKSKADGSSQEGN